MNFTMPRKTYFAREFRKETFVTIVGFGFLLPTTYEATYVRLDVSYKAL